MRLSLAPDSPKLASRRPPQADEAHAHDLPTWCAASMPERLRENMRVSLRCDFACGRGVRTSEYMLRGVWREWECGGCGASEHRGVYIRVNAKKREQGTSQTRRLLAPGITQPKSQTRADGLSCDTPLNRRRPPTCLGIHRAALSSFGPRTGREAGGAAGRAAGGCS